MRRNEMFKKVVAALLLGVLAISTILGCGETEAVSKEESAKEEEQKEPESEAYKETKANVEIIQAYAKQLLSDSKNNPENFATGGFVWDTESKSDSWRYFNGVMMDAFLSLEGDEYVEYAEKFYNDNIAEDGTIQNYLRGELDSVPAALGLFHLLDSENADRYKVAINYIYNELEEQTAYPECGGNFLHKSSWKKFQIGLDGLYMAQPFLIRCANAIDERKLTLTAKDGHSVTAEEIYEAVYHRMYWVAENMYDETSKLYHHGWNVEEASGNGHFWGRGIGWYAVALVDVIEAMPEGENRDKLIGELPKLFDGMISYQDAETGLWYNVVNNPELEKNELETSGSAMMAYALMKACNNDWVGETYGTAGLKAFNGIVETKVVKTGETYSVTGIYQKSGVEVMDEGYVKNDYVADEGKGTGVLIMASTLALEAAK